MNPSREVSAPPVRKWLNWIKNFLIGDVLISRINIQERGSSGFLIAESDNALNATYLYNL